MEETLYNDISLILNYKIKKYRTKSLDNCAHEERMMHYIAQNQYMDYPMSFVSPGINDHYLQQGENLKEKVLNKVPHYMQWEQKRRGMMGTDGLSQKHQME